MEIDLVLSSGFLAFAEHAGFLRAVEDRGLRATGLCGTSSGALVGALWAAGLPAAEILEVSCAATPLSQVGWSRRPWTGLLTLDPIRPILAARLPARLEDLPIPVGLGVADGTRPVLLTEGPAVDAVLASCAVPWLFAPVRVADRTFVDGGAVDRTALRAWRTLRPDPPIALHLVERSAGAATSDDLAGITVARSPRSGARLWNLGDVEARYARSRRAALDALEP